MDKTPWHLLKAYIFVCMEEGKWEKWEISVQDDVDDLDDVECEISEELIVLRTLPGFGDMWNLSVWDRDRRKLLSDHPQSSFNGEALCYNSTVVFLNKDHQLEVIHYKNMTRWSHSEVKYSSSVPTPTSFCLLKDFRYPYVVVEAGPSEEEEEEGEEEDSLVVLKIDNEACEVTEVTRIRVTESNVIYLHLPLFDLP